MNKIDAPRVFVCMAYNQLYDDYDQVIPSDFIRDIPSIKALEFIISKMNSVIYAFSDVETQKGFIYEAMCYFDDTVRSRVASFLAKHDHPYFMDNQSCFMFFMLILQNYNSETRELNSQDINNLYKAYLYCSQIWTDKQCVESETFSSITEASIRIDLPVVEFKLHKDFRSQIYKASRFFHFCETNKEFNEFSKWFCKEMNVADHIEYITRLFSFYTSTFDNIRISIPNEFSSQIPFFDQYAINFDDCTTIWDNKDLNYLRNHFLLKVSNDTYLVLNTNLLVDKLYQGLIFDFWNVVKKLNGTNRKGKPIKDFGEFKSMLGDDYSENNVLYDLIEKSFPSAEYVKLRGNYLKSNGISSEPDYYMRKDNAIFIFEYKDLTISDDVKQSSDYEYIKSEILRRICKDGESNRKGGAQLLYNIDRIFTKDLLAPFDNSINKETVAYPIIVISDRSFDALGVNCLLLEKFTEIAEEKYPHLQGRIKLPVILNIDTLYFLMTRLKNKEIDFQSLIDSYHDIYEKPETCMMPLSTFVIDYYPKSKYEQEELNYMFDDILDQIREKEEYKPAK